MRLWNITRQQQTSEYFTVPLLLLPALQSVCQDSHFLRSFLCYVAKCCFPEDLSRASGHTPSQVLAPPCGTTLFQLEAVNRGINIVYVCVLCLCSFMCFFRVVHVRLFWFSTISYLNVFNNKIATHWLVLHSFNHFTGLTIRMCLCLQTSSFRIVYWHLPVVVFFSTEIVNNPTVIKKFAFSCQSRSFSPSQTVELYLIESASLRNCLQRLVEHWTTGCCSSSEGHRRLILSCRCCPS